MDKVVLIGAGAHAKVIADMLLQMKRYEIVGLIDSKLKDGFMGLSIIGDDNYLKELYDVGVQKAFISIGSNRVRREVFYKAQKLGFEMINIISSSAVISSYVEMGQGIAIMPGVVVNAFTKIGDGCILNTNSSVDHDGDIGKFVHIAPGSAVAGSVSIGENTFCGVGSKIIDKIDIGKNVVIGAGGVVTMDINDGLTVVGVPAKPINC